MSKRILLVSGHVSGYNKCGETGVNEGDLNIELVDMLYDRLYGVADVDVYPIARDWYHDNKSGVSQVNPKDYDYIFEVHFNAGKGTGTSIYLHSDYAGGVSVEERILHNLAELGIRLRGTNGFNRKSSLLNCNVCQRAGVDYALIETLFYDNTADMNLYKSSKARIADAIAKGIISGFGLGKYDEEPDQTAEETDGDVYTYRVQVGSFRDRAKAEELAKSLEALNYPTFIQKVLVQ